jgi:hypothetical protein
VDPDFLFDLDPDSGYQNDADPDPQHWLAFIVISITASKAQMLCQ